MEECTFKIANVHMRFLAFIILENVVVVDLVVDLVVKQDHPR